MGIALHATAARFRAHPARAAKRRFPYVTGNPLAGHGNCMLPSLATPHAEVIYSIAKSAGTSMGARAKEHRGPSP